MCRRLPIRRLVVLALALAGLAPPAAAQSVAGTGAAWAHDGGWLVVTRFDPAANRTELRRWEPKSGRETLLASLPGHASRPRLSSDDRFVAVLRTDQPLAAAYQSAGDLVAVTLATGAAETVHPPGWQAVAWSGTGSSHAWHPQGAQLGFAAVDAAAPDDVHIRMTDLDTAAGGQFVHPDLAFAGEAVGLDWSPDGALAVSHGGGGAYAVWTDAVPMLDAEAYIVTEPARWLDAGTLVATTGGAGEYRVAAIDLAEGRTAPLRKGEGYDFLAEVAPEAGTVALLSWTGDPESGGDIAVLAGQVPAAGAAAEFRPVWRVRGGFDDLAGVSVALDPGGGRAAIVFRDAVTLVGLPRAAPG